MNRVKRRCFAASAVAHGLLLTAFLAGSAFVRTPPPPETLPVVTFLPDKLVDALVVGPGGSPQGSRNPAAPAAARTPPSRSATPPRAAQPAPRPPPAPTPRSRSRPAADTTPARTTTKPAAPAPPPGAPADRQAKPKRTIDVNLKPTARREADDGKAQAAATARAEAQARQLAANAQRDRVEGVANSLESRLSSGGVSATPWEPGGASYANYTAYVTSLYDRLWREPDGLAEDSPMVRVKLTIARDGTVVLAEIVSKSGVAALDKSVREVLERVDSIGLPFPEGAKEEQRIIYLNFKTKASRGLG